MYVSVHFVVKITESLSYRFAVNCLKAWVVPAFETIAPVGTPFEMPETKSKLLNYFARGDVKTFL